MGGLRSTGKSGTEVEAVINVMEAVIDVMEAVIDVMEAVIGGGHHTDGLNGGCD